MFYFCKAIDHKYKETITFYNLPYHNTRKATTMLYNRLLLKPLKFPTLHISKHTHTHIYVCLAKARNKCLKRKTCAWSHAWSHVLEGWEWQKMWMKLSTLIHNDWKGPTLRKQWSFKWALSFESYHLTTFKRSFPHLCGQTSHPLSVTLH